jgi:ACS family tartrate transporter-like MFS transporter
MSPATISTNLDVAVARDDTDLARATIRRVSLRLLPLLFILYIWNYVDRTNVAIAALRMNADLHLSASAYGFGVGIFSLGYVLFEVPSNVILSRVGARRWIARIMISWGLIASAMMFMRTPLHFYLLRFLLGAAEAGFFPGIIYYLSQWFPTPQRARAISRFIIAIPFAGAIGSPLSASLLRLDGRLGLAGWRWLFLVEGIPSVLLGLATLKLLTDRVEDARWLSDEQRGWLVARLHQDADESLAPHGVPLFRALTHPTVWLLAVPYFLIDTGFYGYTYWAPTVIRDNLHASDLTTGLIVGGIAFGAVGVMLAFGASSDRSGERCLHTGAAAALCALGYVGAALLPTPGGRVIGLAVASFGATSAFVPFWCLPSMLLRGRAAAAGIALVNSIGNVSGFVGPYLIGFSKDQLGGTTGAFLVLAGFALAAATFFFVIRRHTAFALPGRVSAPAREPIAVGRASA